MKKIVIVLTFLIGCTSHKDNPNKLDNETDSQIKYVEKVDLGGVWINKKYIEKLKHTGSPRESQSVVTTSLLILPNKLGERASIIWGFHEGTDGILKENEGQIGIYTGDSNKADYSLSLDGNKLIMGDNEFIKSSIQIKNKYPIVEEFLLAGNYKYQDKDIELTNDGKINGIDSLNNFAVALDYEDIGMQVDQIDIGFNDNVKTYGFTFRDNELIIYHLNCKEKDDDLCLEVEIGQEFIKLIKR